MFQALGLACRTSLSYISRNNYRNFAVVAYASMAGKEGVDMVMSGEKLEKVNLRDTENVKEERPPGLTNTVWGQQSLVGAIF